MLFYGKWVSSYKNKDVVFVISKDNGKTYVGELSFQGEFMGDHWFVITRNNESISPQL